MATHLKNLSDFSHLVVPSGKPFQFGIVVASWNEEVTGKLYQGAFESLIKHGVEEENIISVDVAGSYELISGADLLRQHAAYCALVRLRCLDARQCAASG